MVVGVRLVVSVLVVTLYTSVAAAQPQWIDGTFGFQPGLACVTWNDETTVSAFAGYWGTTDVSFPKTGDQSYVRAVAAVVGNPCSGGEVIDFNFQLPNGATPAVTTQTPVVCVATRLSDGTTTTTDPNIHCLQSPTAGTHGGLDFGYAVVPHGWMFEVRVPVLFQRPLAGMAGPAADDLKVAVITTEAVIPVEAWVTAPYRALVNYPTPSAAHQAGVGTNVYRVTTNVFDYYTAGTAQFESGSATGVYSDGIVGSFSVPNTAASYQVYSDLEFGAYTSDVYWRAKYVTASGTFFGAEQHFVANGGNPGTYALTVTKSGAGQGTVTSDPQGLSCGATCSQSYTTGTSVTLTAAPGPGSTFSGWSGACAGTGLCTVAMTAARAVTATFDAALVPTLGTLEVTVDGLPAGSVGSVVVTGPSGFNHTFSLLSGTGQNLSDVAPGTYVGITADVVVGPSTYVARPATASAAVVGGGVGAIAITFALGRQLSVAPAGGGAGTVTSRPSGLTCGATCTRFFTDGEQVILDAAPGSGSTFAGYSGACSGTTCTLTMSASASVTATFNVAPAGTQSLTVTRGGSGAGTVTSSPAGISCGSQCAQTFTTGSSVTLTATPAAGSTFTTWSGACSGSGACVVTMSAAKSVDAAFSVGSASAYALTAAAATAAPASATVAKGTVRAPMLAFDLTGTAAGTLGSVSLSASGTGNDAADLTTVELFVDANGNGKVDAGELAYAAGTFSGNNGSLVLSAPTINLPAGTTHLLVTSTIASTLATAGRLGASRRLPPGWGALAALLIAAAVMLARRGRPQRRWAAFGLAVALAACGGGSSPTTDPSTARTYALTVTAVSAHSGSQTATVAGLPIVGATMSVVP